MPTRFVALCAAAHAVAPHLNPTVALLMLDYLVTHVADPRNAERLGVSRREAVRTAVSIRAGGALRQRAKLRVILGPGAGAPR